MSKPVKVLIAVLGLCVVLAIVVGAAVGYWLVRNEDRLEDAAAEVVGDVERFAEGKSQQDCLHEAFRRAEACGQFRVLCQAETQQFFAVCLEMTSPTDGFCDGVPPPDALVETIQYRLKMCPPGRTAKFDNAWCGQFYVRIQQWCEARVEDDPPADG